MRNITDMTWKDSAIVECRVLLAKLEKLSVDVTIRADDRITRDANQCARLCARLADQIERIEEKPRRRRQPRARKPAANSPA